MNDQKTTILVVDDDDGHRRMLGALLEDWGHACELAASGEEAVRLCEEKPFDLVLMDVRMKGMDGLSATQAIHSRNPAIPIIIMTAYCAIDNAVEAIKLGACDYLQKPLDFGQLKLAIGQAVEHTRDRERAGESGGAAAGDEFIGRTRPVAELLETAATVAPSEATVLLSGESGVGKELLARLIHNHSRRAQGPYVAVNCAALTETLLESELFGHERGAFTGAERRREGRFFAAQGGTLFLDEIGELPLGMQPRLLRALQEREIQRLGDDRPIKVDVRIIAATNRNLQEEVAAGRFREDLFYRLNVVNLRIPPLRERVHDIPLLATHFLEKHAERNGKTVRGFTPAAMDRLLRHTWPGNVRELENAVERAVVLLFGDYVSERELPPDVGGDDPGAHRAGGGTLAEMERAFIADTLEATGGNKSEAARRLGITRKTLLAKLQRGAEEHDGEDL